MACLSPSPSGRRLSELLEEKQEPFSLDLHLLEKGCSPRLLDAYDTALCWPAGGADPAVVLRRLTSKKSKASPPTKNKKKPAGGLLQLLLSKILRGRAAAQRKPAALQCSDSFKLATDDDHHRSLKEEQQHEDAASVCYCSGTDTDSDDDDEKQQLSPVSVLDHPFEASPAHAKLSPPSRAAAMDVFRELLDAAYSPALLTQLLAKTDDLLRDSADEDEYYYGSGCRTSPRRCRDDESAAAYWDAHRAELARVSELVASEVPASRLSATDDVRPERQEVGAEVEAAVLEALMQELVVELLGSRC